MFSIIIPTYNRAYCISNAIKSVLSQLYQNWELLVIDDGSTYDTKKVAESFKDDRIHYIRFFQNRGVNVARNRGIEKARGEWIVLLDSDNTLTHNALQTIAETIQKLNFPFILFPCIDPKGRYTVDNPQFDGFIDYPHYLCGKMRVEYHNIVRVDLLRKYPFFEDIVGGEKITWSLIAKDLQRVLFIPHVTLVYNNELPDRLSQVRKNFSRLYNVYRKDIEILGKDYARNCPIQFLEKLIKYGIYRVLSILT